MTDTHAYNKDIVIKIEKMQVIKTGLEKKVFGIFFRFLGC